MSEENVEIVRRAYAHWQQGDFSAAAEFFDPEISFTSFLPDASEKVETHGLDELAAFTRDWLEQWRDYRIIAHEFQLIDDDVVLVSGRQVATGQHSGVEVESPAFSVWTVRRGKVVRLSAHYDRSDALKAAGLSD